jgi:phage gp45-like
MRDRNTLGREVDPFYARVAGMIRRVAIGVTTRALWQLVGHRMPDGIETIPAEVFSGIGFYSRPPSTGSPEAVVVNVGDAKTPVVVATRDEKTRAAVAALSADEAAVFNTKAILVVKAGGTIELRSLVGVPEKMVKGETYRAAEDIMLTALEAALAALNADAALTPATKTACNAAAAAITAFLGAAGTYLSTVGKVS